MSRRFVLPSLVVACVWCLVGCQSSQSLVSSPVTLLAYQNEPSEKTLDELSKSYYNTITNNRKEGRNQPGLYSEYAATLVLLGRTKEAEEWFNKEIATYPNAAGYVMQLRKDLLERLNGRTPRVRHTIDDVHSPEDIVLLRPTENRRPSELDDESVSKAEQNALENSDKANVKKKANSDKKEKHKKGKSKPKSKFAIKRQQRKAERAMRKEQEASEATANATADDKENKTSFWAKRKQRKAERADAKAQTADDAALSADNGNEEKLSWKEKRRQRKAERALKKEQKAENKTLDSGDNNQEKP